MITRLLPLVVLAALVLIAGCNRAPDSAALMDPLGGMETPPAPEAEKIDVIAYINVASGCQEETVDLVNALAEEYADIVRFEMVDFGSPDGEKRWYGDGMDCMGFLFNGSPALKFPGEDGEPRTVAFLMPAGFGWTHDDLTQAFAAFRAGTAEILSEDEARRELAPQPVEVAVSTQEANGTGEVLMDGEVLFAVRIAMDGKTPLERAEAAKAGLAAWTKTPVHPSQLSVARIDDDNLRLTAGGKEVITVTLQDAEAEGLETPGDLAQQWVESVKASIVQAVRKSQ